MSIEARHHDLSMWILSEQPPADQHPAALYLAGRAPRSRGEARRALDTIAALLTAGEATADTLAWHLLRDEHVAAVRAGLAERHRSREVSRMLGALRGVLKHCHRLGLIPDEAFRRGHAAATGAHQVSRGELRSVFESCAEDGAPSRGRAGAVRTLLYGNGVRQGRAAAPGQAMMEGPDSRVADSRVPDPHAPVPPVPAPSAGREVMSMVHLHLRSAPPREAMAHALWEAGVCLRSSAFCACLAMLRKALDLWSLDYRARHGLDGDDGAADRGGLAGRLTKIAEENRLYADTIAAILDALSCEEGGPETDRSVPRLPGQAGLSPRWGTVCRGGYPSSHDGYAISRIKETYRNLHEQVITLITATTPELPL